MAEVLVVKRIHDLIGFRRGRGFSLSELKECGLTVSEARKKGLKVDELRKTKHEKNIEGLKKWLQSQLKTKGEISERTEQES